MKRLFIIAAGLLALAPSAASGATYSNPQQLKTENFGASDAGPMVPFPSVIDVRGTGATVAAAKVTLNGVAHNTTNEIEIIVSNPSGASLVLFKNACGGQNTLGTPLTFGFDDGAVAPLPTTATCSSGTFKPSWNSMLNPNLGPASPPPPYVRTLAELAGGPADGLWRLYAYDAVLTSDGAITGGWTLDLTLTKPKPKAKKCKRAEGKRKGKRKGCKKPKKRRP